MNKETIKAIKEKEKNVTNIKKWWSRNRYKIMKCIFFPVWFAQLANEKIQRSLNAKIEWSEERAKEIFDYYIPRKSEWDKENKELYFFDNGYGWNMCLAKKYLKKKDRRFWNLYAGGFGFRMREYLIENYCLEGFDKIVHVISDGHTEITFQMK